MINQTTYKKILNVLCKTHLILIPWFTTNKLNNITLVSENAGLDEITVSFAAISATIIPQSIDEQELFKNGNIWLYIELKSINISFSVSKKINLINFMKYLYYKLSIFHQLY